MIDVLTGVWNGKTIIMLGELLIVDLRSDLVIDMRVDTMFDVYVIILDMTARISYVVDVLPGVVIEVLSATGHRDQPVKILRGDAKSCKLCVDIIFRRYTRGRKLNSVSQPCQEGRICLALSGNLANVSETKWHLSGWAHRAQANFVPHGVRTVILANSPFQPLLRLRHVVSL